eukprot:scaffold44814_cov58-Phaeocystis_antarctica.AAC.3
MSYSHLLCTCQRRESRHLRGAATLTATQSVVVHEHLPLPMYEVGFGAFRGLDGLHVAHPGPCHLQQHGVQRLDGPQLRFGCSKRIGQRASDLTHLNVGMRHLDAAECHADRLLPGCRIALRHRYSPCTPWKFTRCCATGTAATVSGLA